MSFVGYPNYPQASAQHPMGYAPPIHSGGQGYYQQPQHTPHGYSVYYNHDTAVGNQAPFDDGRQDLGPLTSLLSDYRQNNFDPKSYHQVHNRLLNLQSSNLSILSDGGMNEYRSLASASPMGDGHGPMYGIMPQHVLPRPIPNLRTKADLLSAEQLVDQMTSTVYENGDQVAMAGIGQPGAIPVQDAIVHRHSHSPSAHHLAPAHYNQPSSVHSTMQERETGSSHGSPPALTPPSSAVSFTSGHSPTSNHAEPHRSPGQAPTASMYPSLPSAGLNGFSHNGVQSTSGAGTSFDNAEQRRRYNSGMLGKAVPMSSKVKEEDEMDITEDGATTPKAAIHPRLAPAKRSQKAQPAAHDPSASVSMIDPALPGAATQSPQSNGGGDESTIKNEQTAVWVQNMRIIETLKLWIGIRLKSGDYEGAVKDEDEVDDSHSLYPVLKEVQASA